MSGTPTGYVSLQVGSTTCFYVSTTQIWPFPNGISQANEAVNRCSSIGLTLATVINVAEQSALKKLFRKLSEMYFKSIAIFMIFVIFEQKNMFKTAYEIYQFCVYLPHASLTSEAVFLDML